MVTWRWNSDTQVIEAQIVNSSGEVPEDGFISIAENGANPHVSINHIDNTIDNYRETEKRINQIDDEITKSEMKIRIFRRDNSIRDMKKEIKNVVDKENNFK